MTPPADARIIELLVSRDGLPTLVTLKSGAAMTVYNIAWGYDVGDEYAHVTTNASPDVNGAQIDFFSTSDIQAISDPASGTALA